MKANGLLGLALGVRLAAIRDSGKPLQMAFAEGQTILFLAHAFQEASEVLASRWEKIPDKNRPQYTPEQRCLGGRRAHAHLFVVSVVRRGRAGRPGGDAAAVGLLAAKRAVELHGGRLEMTPTESGGVRLALRLSEAQ